jgi:hypothetical protein
MKFKQILVEKQEYYVLSDVIIDGTPFISLKSLAEILNMGLHSITVEIGKELKFSDKFRIKNVSYGSFTENVLFVSIYALPPLDYYVDAIKKIERCL